MAGLILAMFYSWFLDDTTEDWVGYTVCGVALIFGIIMGLIMAKTLRFSASIVAGVAGSMLGMVIYDAFLHKYDTGDKPYLLWVTMIVLALVAAFFTAHYLEEMIIFSTALIGSYMIARGISLYAGKFPNEFQLHDLTKQDGYKQPWQTYAYLGGILVGFIISCIIQFKFKHAED